MIVKIKDPEGLKKLLIAKGHSMRSFARTIDISNPYISQILKEERFASGKVAKKISDGLGLPFEEIFFIVPACNSKRKEGDC